MSRAFQQFISYVAIMNGIPSDLSKKELGYLCTITKDPDIPYLWNNRAQKKKRTTWCLPHFEERKFLLKAPSIMITFYVIIMLLFLYSD